MMLTRRSFSAHPEEISRLVLQAAGR